MCKDIPLDENDDGTHEYRKRRIAELENNIACNNKKLETLNEIRDSLVLEYNNKRIKQFTYTVLFLMLSVILCFSSIGNYLHKKIT